jgi:hypothetical protein
MLELSEFVGVALYPSMEVSECKVRTQYLSWMGQELWLQPERVAPLHISVFLNFKVVRVVRGIVFQKQGIQGSEQRSQNNLERARRITWGIT